ncbi:MAG: hypothetical protein NTZ39_05350 [Methanoregula sp.]|nr:hypothetical protein [Methanoregula sp.]
MTGDTTIIRTGSGGSLSIETPDGQYILSRDECRHLIFFSRRILLSDSNGNSAGEAFAYVQPETGPGGERRVIIETPFRFFSLVDRVFVAVADG